MINLERNKKKKRKMVVGFRINGQIKNKIWHSDNFNSFYHFLNKYHYGWLWVNVWNKQTNQQVYNFTNKTANIKKYV